MARTAAVLAMVAALSLGLAWAPPMADADETTGSDYYSGNRLQVWTDYGFRRNACINGGHGYSLRASKARFTRADSQFTARFHSGRAGTQGNRCYSGGAVNQTTTLTKSSPGMASGTTYTWNYSDHAWVSLYQDIHSIGTNVRANLYRSGSYRTRMCAQAYISQYGDPCGA